METSHIPKSKSARKFLHARSSGLKTFAEDSFVAQYIIMHFEEVDPALDLINICKKAGVEVEVVEI